MDGCSGESYGEGRWGCAFWSSYYNAVLSGADGRVLDSFPGVG